MKQSTTSTSSAGIAVDSEERKAIDDVTVIEERNVVNDVLAVIECVLTWLIWFKHILIKHII